MWNAQGRTFISVTLTWVSPFWGYNWCTCMLRSKYLMFVWWIIELGPYNYYESIREESVPAWWKTACSDPHARKQTGFSFVNSNYGAGSVRPLCGKWSYLVRATSFHISHSMFPCKLHKFICHGNNCTAAEVRWLLGCCDWCYIMAVYWSGFRLTAV